MMFDAHCSDIADQFVQTEPTTYVQPSVLSTGSYVDWIDQTSIYLRIDFDNASTYAVIRLNNVDQCEVAASTVVDRVQRLDKGLDIPRKTLADVLGISRTTLYELLNGKLREYRNEERLQQIENAYEILSANLDYPVGRSVSLVKLNGLSLADVLMSEDINLEKVGEFAKAINNRKSSLRDSALSEDDSIKKYLITPIAD